MIVTRLCELARRENLLDDPAFVGQRIRFLVQLSEEGAFLGLTETQGKLVTRGKKETHEPKEFLTPKVGNRTDGKTPCLLADTIPRVVAGRGAKQADHDTHANFVKLTAECAESTRDPAAIAVCRFLDAAEADLAVLEPLNAAIDAKKPGPSDWIGFDVEGYGLVLGREAVKGFWRQKHAARAARKLGSRPREAQCLACGRVAPPHRGHGKIKGVPGANSAGASLISADAVAFESLGLRKSATSPVCADCAEAYTRALGWLLSNDRTRYRDGDGGVAYVFWTREPVEFDPMVIVQPDPDNVRKLLESPYRPGHRNALAASDPNAFYALSLTGVGGRVMVRDWIEETVPTVCEHLAEWFADIAIVLDRPLYSDPSSKTVREGGGPGSVWNAWPLQQLVRAAGRRQERGHEVSGRVSSALFRAAVLGQCPGEDVLSAVVRRIRAEAAVRPARAALLRLTINRLAGREAPGAHQGGITMSERLDTAQANLGYRCGRLLCILARLQYLALGKTNATIVDSYYGAASTTPASVFGRLIHLAQAHLGKLGAADRSGVATNIRKDIEEIIEQPEPMMEFPLQLSLQDQGRFALGFYHQSAEYRARSADRGGSEGGEVLAGPGEADSADISDGE